MISKPRNQSNEETSSVQNAAYNEALWRKYAQVYDAVLNVIPYQNLLLELVDVANITPSMRLFDGCCGTGNLLWALEKQKVICDVMAVDYSEAMLAKARMKQYAGKVAFVRANLDEMSESWGIEGTFDRFIFNNCLSFVADPANVLRQVGKLASDDAVLVASMPRPNPNITELLDQHLELSQNLGISREEALKRMMPKLQPIMKSNEALMKQYGDSYHLPSIQQLRGWFVESGWVVESVTATYAGQNWLVVANRRSQS